MSTSLNTEIAASASANLHFRRTRGRNRWLWFLGFCLLLAAVLRFINPQDIEYKRDERWFFGAVEQYRQGGALPAVGLPSSDDRPAPGLSLWIFLFLGRGLHVDSPVGLARSVAALNMLALLILILVAQTLVPVGERPVWNWTAALVCVNSFSVLFGRKIWNPCVLPLFTICLIAAWFRRDRPLGAFFLGLLMTFVGQIHMAGFFFAAALLAWSWLFERFRQVPRRVPWLFLAAGMALGSLPLIPWLPYLRGHASSVAGSAAWIGFLPSKYWYEWIRLSLGIGLDYSLGSVGLRDFLRGPVIAGHATFGVLALQAVTVGMVARLLGLLLRSRKLDLPRLLGAHSETAFLESAGLWGTGVFLTLVSMPLYIHYLLVMYPLPWLWIARLGTATGRKGRVGLAVIWGAQLLVSVSFLLYIHAHHGAVYGDYGIGYGYQPK